MIDAEDQAFSDFDGGMQLGRFREMFAHSPTFSALLDGPEHRFVFTNPAYQKLIGHRDVIGLSVREAIPEVESQGFVELLDNVFETGNAYTGANVEILLQGTPGGPAETRFLDFAYQPIKDAKGNVRSIFVQGADVTEKRAWEDALRASEASLRQLNADLERRVAEHAQARSQTWQLSPDLLGALNSKGYFETSNPAWLSVLGWTEAEVASMSIFELLHPEDREHTRAGFELTQVGQPAIGFANRYRCKAGSYRWISWVGIPEDGFVYCTGRDITAEKAAEAELSAAQDALRQSQKLEALGGLTGGIAHDFNNHLTAIICALDVLRRRLAAGRHGDIPRLMDAASASAYRAAGLTQRLLAFARRQSLDIKPNDINQLIESMEDLLRHTLGEQIELQTSFAIELWAAFIDGNQLESAVLNLAINARDAMPDGGRLTIETANQRVGTDCTSLRQGIEPGDYVLVSISDTGTGMSPNVLAKAVEPFFTTKPVGQGTGLGLSVIHGFAQQSGGHLRIDSEVGWGTTVQLYLPRAVKDIVARDAARVKAVHGRGETILVVEDDATLRLIIVEVLEELGYRSLAAADARAAIPVLQSDQLIDLLISDVVLPHINGT